MQVYIVHGYCASGLDHWFFWLAEELRARGARVSIVELPAREPPEPDEWQVALATQVHALDRNSYFVSHSLGGIATLRYLESAAANETIGGYILVSGFNARLATLPQLDAFATPNLNCLRLANMAGSRVVIAARDDPSVPHAMSERLAISLRAAFVSVPRGGHFLASDGFCEFPLLLGQTTDWFGRASDLAAGIRIP